MLGTMFPRRQPLQETKSLVLTVNMPSSWLLHILLFLVLDLPISSVLLLIHTRYKEQALLIRTAAPVVLLELLQALMVVATDTSQTRLSRNRPTLVIPKALRHHTLSTTIRPTLLLPLIEPLTQIALHMHKHLISTTTSTMVSETRTLCATLRVF